MEPTFFGAAADFREWLARHHASKPELLLGFFKKGSGEPGMTWSESVDEALCYGWIDGVRKRIDDRRYTIRFTPRRPGSIWSKVNLDRVRVLIRAGRMQPAGLAAYEARTEAKSGVYSYEQRSARLGEPYERLLRQPEAAWDFFQDQAPWYRRAASWWVVSAKKEETRLRRLEKLRDFSAKGERLPHLISNKPSR